MFTTKSAALTATQLHCARQNNRSIDDYAKNIDDILLNLTLIQAEGDSVNEKLAINAFSNGLREFELRTIIKARDPI